LDYLHGFVAWLLTWFALQPVMDSVSVSEWDFQKFAKLRFNISVNFKVLFRTTASWDSCACNLRKWQSFKSSSNLSKNNRVVQFYPRMCYWLYFISSASNGELELQFLWHISPLDVMKIATNSYVRYNANLCPSFVGQPLDRAEMDDL